MRKFFLLTTFAALLAACNSDAPDLPSQDQANSMAIRALAHRAFIMDGWNATVEQAECKFNSPKKITWQEGDERFVMKCDFSIRHRERIFSGVAIYHWLEFRYADGTEKGEWSELDINNFTEREL